jgi:hypothetical protein
MVQSLSVDSGCGGRLRGGVSISRNVLMNTRIVPVVVFVSAIWSIPRASSGQMP